MFRPRAIVMVVAALLSVVVPSVAHASAQAADRGCTVVTVIVHQHHPSVWICLPLV